MSGVEESEWLTINYVELRPGVRVWVTDRDHGNWEYEGVIVHAPRRGERDRFDVKFDNGYVFPLNLDQTMPVAEEEQKPDVQARRKLHQMRIFLCHGSEDKAPVRTLYEKLREAKLNPWLDEIDIPPGREWDAEVRRAIQSSDIVLACLSNRSVTKTGYVQKEIRFALDRADEMPEDRVYIIPVRLEECLVPERLRRWQWIDLFEPAKYDRLISALREYARQAAY